MDYDDVSWFYVNTTGIKAGTKLSVAIYKKNEDDEPIPILHLAQTIDEYGVLKAKIQWNKIPKIKKLRKVFIIIKDEKGKVLYNAISDVDKASTNLQFSPTAIKMVENKAAVVVGTQDVAVKKDDNKCVNCDKSITIEELKKIFTKADNATLKKVSETYSKHMKDLGMNTCWNKAHFFAQAYVESGLGLHVKDGEGFNYYYKGLSIFSAFNSKDGKENAILWGRPVITPLQPGVTQENQKKIANWAYFYKFSKGKELGNTEVNDGWNYRGKGLIQLTGRDAYKYANSFTIKEGADIIKNPDLVITDISIAVISSMAFFKWKNITTITNGNANTKPISVKVGKEVGSSYTEKQNAFDLHTSKVFKINECNFGAEDKTTSKWHEPVRNPISTLYMQSGGGGAFGEHWGLFGNTRNGKTHQGLDLFALLGTDVFACADGEIFESKKHNGYGKTLTIKITDKEAFYKHRRDYKLLYPNAGEIIQGPNFDKTNDIFLFYAHLQKVLVKKGEKIKSGKVIAKTGVSGVQGGTCAPHLHFEIFTTLYAVGKDLNYRCNPGYYVHYKNPTQQTKADKELQKKTKDNGKINEVNGKD